MTHKHEIVIERASIERETCHIGKLIVHPNHQNLGIGTILLSAAEQHFPEAQRYEHFTGQESELLRDAQQEFPRVERCPMKAGAISIKASYRFKKPDGSYEGGKVNFIPETS